MDGDKSVWAMENNAFVRDREEDVVYCPMGQVLSLKSVKKDGRRRYMNKHACRVCERRCFSSSNSNPWKEIDFSPRVDVKMVNDLQHEATGMRRRLRMPDVD